MTASIAPLPEDTSPSQPPWYEWLRRRRYKLWQDTLGLHVLCWLVFSAGVALAPIGIAVITSPSGGRLVGELPSAVANGEIFSAALFGSVSGHNQETRNDQVTSERTISMALQNAIKNKDKKPTSVVSVRLNPVDVGKYLEAHKDDATLREGRQWPQPRAVASRSFYLLIAALRQIEGKRPPLALTARDKSDAIAVHFSRIKFTDENKPILELDTPKVRIDLDEERMQSLLEDRPFFKVLMENPQAFQFLLENADNLAILRRLMRQAAEQT